MYQPRSFQLSDQVALRELVQAHPLASVIVHLDGQTLANHVPLEWVGEAHLHGHVARGNELARADGAEVLAIFHGADGYVSPNWYPSKQLTHREVPTWNYAVVHVHGRLRVIKERAWLLNQLNQLVDRHEASEPAPWKVADAPVDHIDNMLGAIVGVDIAIERIEAKFKLSQNHPPANRAGVREGLARRERGRDAELGQLMAAAEARRTQA